MQKGAAHAVPKKQHCTFLKREVVALTLTVAIEKANFKILSPRNHRQDSRHMHCYL